MGRGVRGSCGGHGPAGSPSSPCGRDPDRGLKLPLTPACRTGARACSLESPDHPATGTPAPRPSTRRESKRSSNRLITGPILTRQLGKIEGPYLREVQRPLTGAPTGTVIDHLIGRVAEG